MLPLQLSLTIVTQWKRMVLLKRSMNIPLPPSCRSLGSTFRVDSADPDLLISAGWGLFGSASCVLGLPCRLWGGFVLRSQSLRASYWRTP